MWVCLVCVMSSLLRTRSTSTTHGCGSRYRSPAKGVLWCPDVDHDHDVDVDHDHDHDHDRDHDHDHDRDHDHQSSIISH